MKVSVFIAALVLAFLTGNAAKAAIGQVDQDQFPFVVRIEIDDSWCTGVVTTDNLLTTAAHCVWHKEKGLAKSALIRFTDFNGVERIAHSRAIFIPDTYPSADEEKQKYTTADHMLADADRWEAADMRRAMQDIAFIVPDRVIEIEGYAHWVTELLVPPYSNYLEQINCNPGNQCTDRPTKAQEFGLIDIITKELGGDLLKVRGKIAGYGGFDCLKYEVSYGNDDCKRDGQRRVAEAPFVPFMNIAGERYGVPWVWCTGKNDQGVNPVRHGDSGGPMFVRAADGRWLFTGYLAVGGRLGCSSSLIYNLALWKKVLDSEEYSSIPSDHAEEWHVGQAKRAFFEALEVLSSPNDEALARLRNIYGVIDEENSGVGINGENMGFKDAYNQKKAFFELWPKRKYTVVAASLKMTSVTLRPGHESPHAFYQAKALVKWEFENPTTKNQKSGASVFKALFNMNGLNASQLIGHGQGPIIMNEVDPTIGSPRSEVTRFEGFDFPGNDLDWIYDSTMEDCVAECLANWECKAFTLNQTSNVCITKSKVGRPMPVRDASSGTTNGIRPSFSPAPTIILRAGIDYSGAEYASPRYISLEDCKSQCATDTRCQSFSYHTSKQWCFLKSGVGEARNDVRTVGGIKQK